MSRMLLVTPLIAARARQTVEDAWRDYRTELTAFGFNRRQAVSTLLHDCRFTLVVAALAGLGRAMSEVGAVIIAGGNIDGFTRVMTTAIALETSKGDLPLSSAMALVLASVVTALNALAYGLRQWAMRRHG